MIDSSVPSGYLWKKPVKVLASIEARFFSRTKQPSGKLGQPRPGVHELVQEYDDRPIADKLPALPFTRCEVSIGFNGKISSDGESESDFLKLRCDGVGDFKGNSFKGAYKDTSNSEFFGQNIASTVTATIGPRTLKSLETSFPEIVSNFTATLSKKTRDGKEGDAKTTTTTLTVNGRGLKLNPNSPLLKTRIPFHRFMQDERLRRKYGYAFLQYWIKGDAVKGKMGAQYQQQTSCGKKSKSSTLSEVESSESAYLVVTFWFY